MAWETRKGCASRYYYKSVRIDGKVKKIYLGKGIAAYNAAWLANHVRRLKVQADRLIELERINLEQVMTLTFELSRFTNCITEAALLCAGFKRSNDGQWRKSHERKQSNDKTNNQLKNDLEATELLLQRARRGDSSVLPKVREYLAGNPLQAIRDGNLAGQTQATWIDKISGSNLYRRECITDRIGKLRKTLLSEGNSPLELMLIENAITLNLMSEYYLSAEADVITDSPKWAEVSLKRIKVAVELSGQAIQSLATFRKLIPSGSANLLVPTKQLSDALCKKAPLAASELPSSGILPPVSSTPDNLAIDASKKQPVDLSPLNDASSMVTAMLNSNRINAIFPQEKCANYVRPGERSILDLQAARAPFSRFLPLEEPRSLVKNDVADGTLKHSKSRKIGMLAS